jgi:AcrR family transcriptional regulator
MLEAGKDGPVANTRRTQAERTAETTAKVLDAAASSLVELGYTGTTTTEVCRRAGVSRGALLHHFPTKDELVAGAVEYVVDLRVEEFRVTLSALPADTGVVERLETAIDVLWGIFRGPTVTAWIELAVASRTDPALGEHLHRVQARLDEAVSETWSELFPPDDALPVAFYEVAPSFLFAILDGLALRELTGLPGEAARSEVVVLTLKVIVRSLASLDPSQITDQLDQLLEGVS